MNTRRSLETVSVQELRSMIRRERISSRHDEDQTYLTSMLQAMEVAAHTTPAIEDMPLICQKMEIKQIERTNH